MANLELHIDPPAYNLPSSNPRCIALQLMTSAAGIPVETVVCSYGYSAMARGPLPALRWHREVSPAHEVVDYLQAKYYDFDAEYDLATQTDIIAAGSLLKELHLLHLWLAWLHGPAYNNITCASAFTQVSLPVRIYLRDKTRRGVWQLLSQRIDLNPKTHKTEHYVKSIVRLLSLFAQRLGDGPYLYGDTPTSADFELAAHIAWFRNFAPPSTFVHSDDKDQPNPIRDILETKFPSLVIYANSMLKINTKSFKAGKQQLKPERKLPTVAESRHDFLESQKKNDKDVSSNSNKKKSEKDKAQEESRAHIKANDIFFGVAVFTMLTYVAIKKGSKENR